MVKWSDPFPAVPNPPIAGNGSVFVVANGALLSLDAATGSTQWSVTVNVHTETVPVLAGGKLWFAVTGFPEGTTVVCVTTAGAACGSTTFAGLPAAISVAVANGRFYWDSANGGNSDLYAVDATSLKLLWIARVPVASGVNQSSPAVAYNRVYLGGRDGRLYAFNASDGNLDWTSAPTGSEITASPSVTAGTVVVGWRDNSVYGFNAFTGSTMWSFTTGAPISSSAAMANGVVYVGSDDGHVYALPLGGGSLLWSGALSNNGNASPAVANGQLITGSWDGHVFAYDLAGPADGHGDDRRCSRSFVHPDGCDPTEIRRIHRRLSARNAERGRFDGRRRSGG